MYNVTLMNYALNMEATEHEKLHTKETFKK